MPTGNSAVIAALQNGVSLHLTAIENYQTQADHFERWGYPKLAEKYRADVEEERGHLKALHGRLEFYDIQPTFEHAAPSWPRHSIEGILAANLTLESGAANAEREAATMCREQKDILSALVFESNLAGSEESVEQIEAAQLTISQIGVDNYLASFI